MKHERTFQELRQLAYSNKRKHSFPLFRDKFRRVFNREITEQDVLDESESDKTSADFIFRLNDASANNKAVMTLPDLPEKWVAQNRESFAFFGKQTNEHSLLMRLNYSVSWWLKVDGTVFFQVPEWTRFYLREFYLTDSAVENGLKLDWNGNYDDRYRSLKNLWALQVFGEKWSKIATDIFKF